MPPEFLAKTAPLKIAHSLPQRARKCLQIVLYAFVVLLACPIRYWPLADGGDATWRFALNYAAVQGSAVASQVVFPTGPLGYLLFPQHIGNNLIRGLLFQTGLWLVLAAILADVFFLAGFRLRNLALFSFCFALMTPLLWFDYVGTENLIIAGALMLIVAFQLRGSRSRYLGALVLIGFLPLFKLSAALIGFAALAGFLVERVIQCRRKALADVVLALSIPAAVTLALCLCVMPSLRSVVYYLHGGIEITSGYSAAMSIYGSRMELLSAAEAVAVLAAVLLLLLGSSAPRLARFYALLLAVPLFVSFKHGFVRQDEHAVHFFGFLALMLALLSLAVQLDKVGLRRVVPLMLLFLVIWQDNISFGSIANLIVYPSGVQAARKLWGALRFHHLEQRLDATATAFPEAARIEPEILKLIGGSPMASLSYDFTNAAAAGMSLQLYPVVQRYSAYTPYLDELNATWIRDHGPKFLVFDGKAIDLRDAWAETPAMWLEVYRWYDTRLSGTRHLLLERRTRPRFAALQTIGRFLMPFTGKVRFPVSRNPVFWTMKCGYSTSGRLRKLLFRVPAVFMSVHEADGSTRSARVIPEVLVAPVLGNYLPANLAQFAAVFQSDDVPNYSVDHVAFEDSGRGAYSSTCQVELLQTYR